MSKIRFLLTVIALLVIGENRAAAAEAVGMEILQDGEHIAGFTVTYSGESEAEIWLMLRNMPLTFERDFSIPTDPSDSTTATLTGSIEIRTHRRGDPGSGTRTEQLRLVLRGSTDWYVAESDIDRTLMSAGLKIPGNAPVPEENAPLPKDNAIGIYWCILLCLMGLVAVVAVILVVRRRSSRATAQQ